jgi:hypothetical protein
LRGLSLAISGSEFATGCFTVNGYDGETIANIVSGKLQIAGEYQQASFKLQILERHYQIYCFQPVQVWHQIW